MLFYSPSHTRFTYSRPQVYDECPAAGSTDCFESTTEAVGCAVASVAGRVGSSYAARLEGPESVSGTVKHAGDGTFTAEYVGPIAGVYELQVGSQRHTTRSDHGLCVFVHTDPWLNHFLSLYDILP